MPSLPFKRCAAQTIAALAVSSNMAFAQAAAPFPATEGLSISIQGYLDEQNVSQIMSEITDMRAANPDTKIRVVLFDSVGGNIEFGFQLAQTIYEAGNIDLVCRGDIKSMTAVLFSSYQGGQRIAAADCENMTFHDLINTVWSPMAGGVRLIRSQLNRDAADLNQAMEIMSLGISQASSIPQETAQALFGADCHLSPDQAYSLGLLDVFEQRSTPLPEQMANPAPDDIYEICNTRPLSESLPSNDWSRYNFGLR